MNIDNLTFLENPTLKGSVSVLGIPVDIRQIGTATAPNYIRNFGLLNALESIGLQIEDLGNISPSKKPLVIGDKKVKYLQTVVSVVSQAAPLTADAVAKGNKVIALGGDHTAAIGVISGASAACKGDLGVIWFDTHGDANTPDTTISGNIHGMPAAVLLGLGHPQLTNIFQEGAKIKKEHMLHIGLKDLDLKEVELMRSEKLNVVTMLDITRYGFEFAIDKITALSNSVQNIWISLDVDVLDKTYSPGTDLATYGGLNYREIVNFAKFIGKTCPVIGMDVCEITPRLDVENKTANLAVEIITNLLGSERSWYTDYMHQYNNKNL